MRSPVTHELVEGYGLFDLARAVPLREAAMGLKPPMGDSLIGWNMGYLTVANGPYLVRRDHFGTGWAHWQKWGWNQDWGMEVYSPHPFDLVRAHLKKFNFAVAEATGTTLRFRLYDPRVFRLFMPEATPDQKAKLFKLVDRIVCPLPRPPWRIEYAREDSDAAPARVPFVISGEQAERLRARRLSEFRFRALNFVCANVEEAADWPDARLDRALDVVMEAAPEHGVQSERGIMLLLAATVMRRENVFAIPEVRAILRDGERSEGERIDAVIAIL